MSDEFDELREARGGYSGGGGAGSGAAPGRQQQPEAGLGEWDAGDDVEPPPPRGWLLGNVFARTFLSELIAEGGTGKTAVRYAQGLSLATDRPLTGEHIFQRCRVLIVSLEDDDKELRRRILAARLHYGIDASELRGWLFLAAPGARAGKLLTLDPKGRPVLGSLAAKLEAVIVARKIDLVMLDPFIKSHAVPESDNNLIDLVAQILTDLAAKYDIAVDVPHHSRKGAAEAGNVDRGRGASAAKDAARLVYTLTVMDAKEAEMFGIPEDQRRLYVRMDSAKVNLVPPMAATWFKLVGVPLGNANDLYPNGDVVQTVEPWSPPKAWAGLDNAVLNRILDYIDEGLRDGSGQPAGERYTDSSAAKKRAAWHVVQQFAPQKTEEQCRTIIREWVRNGVLLPEEYYSSGDRKTVSGPARQGCQTPWNRGRHMSARLTLFQTRTKRAKAVCAIDDWRLRKKLKERGLLFKHFPNARQTRNQRNRRELEVRKKQRVLLRG